MSVDRSHAPEVHPFGKINVPPQRVTALPNGMTMHIFNGGDQPVCNISIFFPAGAAEIGSECKATLLMSQTIEGNAAYSSEEIANMLDFNGVRTGFRAASHHSIMDFSMLNHRAGVVMPLIAEIMTAPTFPEQELKTAKLRISSSLLASREDVSALAGDKFNELICGEGNILGKELTQEIIDRITAESLREEYRQIFDPSGMHIYLSGLLTEELIDLVSTIFGQIQGQGRKPEPVLCPLTGSEPRHCFIAKDDAFQSAVICGFTTIGRRHPDYIPLRLTIMALGGYFGSRLMSNIREEKGLTYGIGASLSGSQDGAFLSIAAQCDCANADTVIAEIKNEMRLLASNPPEGEELERLKLFAMTSLAEMLDTPRSILGYYSTMILVGTPPDYFEAQQKAIEELDSDTISAMAKKYLDPDRLITVVAGGKEELQAHK